MNPTPGVKGHLLLTASLSKAEMDPRTPEEEEVKERIDQVREQIWAARLGNLERLKEVVSPVSVNQVEYGRTALFRAAEMGHHACLLCLIENGADVNKATDRAVEFLSPLCVAASHGHLECVETLLRLGADASIGDPLSHAVEGGHVDCLSAILRARPGAIDTRALFNAARLGHARCIAPLVAAGASVNAQDRYGHTPLFVAFQRMLRVDTRIECMRLLIHCGAQVDSTSPPVCQEYAQACRVACGKSVIAIIGLRRSRSTLIAGNGKDALTLVGLCLWETRQRLEWGVDDNEDDNSSIDMEENGMDYFLN